MILNIKNIRIKEETISPDDSKKSLLYRNRGLHERQTDKIQNRKNKDLMVRKYMNYNQKRI